MEESFNFNRHEKEFSEHVPSHTTDRRKKDDGLMTSIAFGLILISVFFHAGWNFLSKKCVPSLAFYAIASTTATLLWLPGFLCSSRRLAELPGEFWWLWLASVAGEVAYFFGLANAYRRYDISLVYPMARALPVLLTALATVAAGIGAVPGVGALAGMAVVSAGCLLMPLARWRDLRLRSYRNIVLVFILLAAAGTTGYTVIDSMAMAILRRSSGQAFGIVDSMFYLFLIEGGLAAGLLIGSRLSRVERAEFRRLFGRSAAPMLSGLFASSAYLLVLAAMGFVSNVSYVQAFRQMSLPLGVLAGILFLHEKPGAPRLAGIALVVTGLVVVALG